MLVPNFIAWPCDAPLVSRWLSPTARPSRPSSNQTSATGSRWRWRRPPLALRRLRRRLPRGRSRIALSADALNGLPGTVESRSINRSPRGFTVSRPAPAPYRFNTVDGIRGATSRRASTTSPLRLHFYLIPREERDSILPDDPDYGAKSARVPDAALLPTGYIAPPDGTVPRMGTHWIDPTSHEFHGQPFNQTLIYGSWNGRVAFLEPMVSLAYLETGPDSQTELRGPERVEIPGVYPTRYIVRRDLDSGETRIGLGGLVQRN